jgi:ribonuclease T1
MLRLLVTLLLAGVLGLARAEVGEILLADLPPEARQTLVRIRQGGPFPYKRDGIVFQNRERRLPAKPRGYYLEYTVPTPGARDRGARRIVVGRGATADIRRAEAYYTEDHYRTFQRIVEKP